MKLFKEKGFGDFKGKTAAILAGTGPVGVVAAKLYASEGGNVVLTSRKLERATAAADKINEELGTKQVCGVQAATPEETGEAIKDAEMILACGAAGFQLLPLSILEKCGKKLTNACAEDDADHEGDERHERDDIDKRLIDGVPSGLIERADDDTNATPNSL